MLSALGPPPPGCNGYLSETIENEIADELAEIKKAEALLAGINGMNAQSVLSLVAALLEKIEKKIDALEDQIKQFSTAISNTVTEDPKLTELSKKMKAELSALEESLDSLKKKLESLLTTASQLASNGSNSSDAIDEFVQATNSTLQKITDTENDLASTLKSMMNTLSAALDNPNPATSNPS